MLKKSISKFHFVVKLYEIRKKVKIKHCLLDKDLQVSTVTFFHKSIYIFDKTYIFHFNLKKYD